MEGFRNLKEREAVGFTFQKSGKVMESIQVTSPDRVFYIGNESSPKGRTHKSRDLRCYSCRGLDHYAKE